MKYFISLLLALVYFNAQAQIPLYEEPKKGKQKKQQPVRSKPEKKTEYFDEAKKFKKSDESWLNGKLHGKCIYYFKSGKVQRTGYYKEGKEDSLWLFYYETGQLKAQENFFLGKKNGTAKYWYPNGNYFLTCRYVENLADSTWTSYYEDGVLKSVEQYKIVFHNFQLLSYKHGHFKFYSENGSPQSDGFFENDTLHGLYSGWYPNGKQKETGNYKRGKKDGLWKEWYVNGKP